MNTIMPLTGRIVFHRDALDEIIVTDNEGNTLAERALPENLHGTAAWDRALFNAGYRRTSDWRPSPSGFRCHVEPV